MDNYIDLRVKSKHLANLYKDHPEIQSAERRKRDFQSLICLSPENENYEQIKLEVSKITQDNSKLFFWLVENNLSYDDLFELIDLPQNEKEVLKTFIPDLQFLLPMGGLPPGSEQSIQEILNILTDIETWKTAVSIFSQVATKVGEIMAIYEGGKLINHLLNKDKSNIHDEIKSTVSQINAHNEQVEKDKRKKKAAQRRKFNHR